MAPVESEGNGYLAQSLDFGAIDADGFVVDRFELVVAVFMVAADKILADTGVGASGVGQCVVVFFFCF